MARTRLCPHGRIPTSDYLPGGGQCGDGAEATLSVVSATAITCSLSPGQAVVRTHSGRT
jgi:hypothetical protein